MKHTDPSSFLTGDRRAVARIRTAVVTVVRCFNLPGGWEEELVQECVGRVFLGVAEGRYRGEAALATYGARVAKYTCLEFLRTRRWSAGVDVSELRSPDGSENPEKILLREQRFRHGLSVFASMPQESRELLLLIFVEGLSYREAAGRLGVSEGALRVRVLRCREKYRASLAKFEKSPRESHG